MGTLGCHYYASYPMKFTADELSLMCYGDDPLVALHGTPEDRNLFAAISIVVWEALGFALAYRKGQLGKEITWRRGTI